MQRRHRNWNWEHMTEFRQLCRTYSKAYQNKLTSRKVAPDVQDTLDHCERHIDVFNIVLIRQKIEMEVIQCFSFCFKEVYMLNESSIRIFTKSVILNCILTKPYF